MTERESVVTMKGQGLVLLGNEVKVGDSAEDVTLVGNDLGEVKLSSYRGQVCIISVVPSLDTPVCDVMTRRFNEAAGELAGDVVVLTISADLPFAQARWCGAADADNVVTLSDYRDAAFGQAYGVLIKGLRLLARAVFIVDIDGVVRYEQIVPELTDEPDYDAALRAAKALLAKA
ncbi:MAG: thiol peroxidase [Planctomycetes bacterium]|nr:thiol peroxidase [Planctomycetota bacterium]